MLEGALRIKLAMRERGLAEGREFLREGKARWENNHLSCSRCVPRHHVMKQPRSCMPAAILSLPSAPDSDTAATTDTGHRRTIWGFVRWRLACLLVVPGHPWPARVRSSSRVWRSRFGWVSCLVGLATTSQRHAYDTASRFVRREEKGRSWLAVRVLLSGKSWENSTSLVSLGLHECVPNILMDAIRAPTVGRTSHSALHTVSPDQ